MTTTQSNITHTELTMEEYALAARSTAMYENFLYPVLGLAGESGEFCEKVKKLLREKPKLSSWSQLSDDQRRDMILELGDILWYVAALAHELGMPLNVVARMNLDKLADRKRRGVISGSGDHR